MYLGGIQLEAEFGMGPVFALSTVTVGSRGCDGLREGELVLTHRLLPFNARYVTCCRLQTSSAVTDKPGKEYNSIGNGKHPNLILSGIR